MESLNKKIIINCETGEVIETTLSDADLAQQQIDEQQSALAAEQAEAQAAIKANAQAKLAALGLTADEIAALSK